MKYAPSYTAIVWTARVTSVFCVMIGVGLLATLANPLPPLPLDDPQFVTLKDQYEANPRDTALQEQLRSLDVQLRSRYFQQLAFIRRGSYLLAGGIAATLLLAHGTLTMKRRLPVHRPTDVVPTSETRQNQYGQLAAIVLVVGVAVTLFTSNWSSRSVLGELETIPVDPSTTLGNTPRDSSEPLAGGSATPAPEADEPAEHVDVVPSDQQFGANWHCFRGPHGAGVATTSDVPQTWNGEDGEGILWTIPIELPGASSPIVWDDRVFLTGATAQDRAVYCIDADSGHLLWTAPVGETSIEADELDVEESTGFAAPTPVTDGRRVYAIFANGHLAAFDYEGQSVWSREFGIPDNSYGHASSLAICRDRLIVQLDQGAGDDEKSRLYAIQTSTGEVAWEAARDVPTSWSSPLVVDFQGQMRIITNAEPWIIAYAADDGRELWRANVLKGEIGPSAVYGDGTVFVANDNSVVAAIRDGGEGDVTETHVVWTAEFALPDICSPVLTDNLLLLVASYGGLAAYDREHGGDEPLWEEDLSEIHMASPTRVGDYIYLIGEKGNGEVVKPTEMGIERVAKNALGERCSSSPAFQDGRIYIRGEEHLFCVGKK